MTLVEPGLLRGIELFGRVPYLLRTVLNLFGCPVNQGRWHIWGVHGACLVNLEMAPCCH